jgi:hypothetical protein
MRLILSATLLLLGTSVQAIAGDGRYQIVAPSSGYIVMVDTKTGATRTCFVPPVSDNPKPPNCGSWSKK